MSEPSSTFRSPNAQSPYVAVGARPTLVTAMAVVSIVVASLNLVGLLIGALTTKGAFAVAAATATQARSVIARAGASADTGAVAAESLRRSALARRVAMLDLLVKLEPTAAPWRRQLDALLARHGAAIFPAPLLTYNNLTADDLADHLRDHGVKRIGSDDRDATVFFLFATGRVEVTADGAMFTPLTGSGLWVDVASLTAGPEPVNAFDVAAKSATLASVGGYAPLLSSNYYASGLSGDQINVAVASVSAAVGPASPSPQQLSALQTELQSADPVLVPPEFAYSPVRTAEMESDGTLVVRFPGGALVLTPDGSVLEKVSEAAETVTLHPLALSLMAGETAASGLLALLLLAAGISALLGWPNSAAFHWLYLLLKLPLVVLAVVMFNWVTGDIDRGIARLGVGASSRGDDGHVFWYTVLVCGGLYPVALLALLNNATVRHHLAATRGRLG